MLTCLHAYMLTCWHAYMLTYLHVWTLAWFMLTCLHPYMRTRLHACAYMFARLYALICLDTTVFLNAYVLTCLRATPCSPHAYMLRADSLHAYVLTRSHACVSTCLHDYMRTRLHALAYMLARLYVFTCWHTPVLLHAYVYTRLHATPCSPPLDTFLTWLPYQHAPPQQFLRACIQK